MGCVWIQDAAESPETDGQDDVENDFEDYEAVGIHLEFRKVRLYIIFIQI